MKKLQGQLQNHIEKFNTPCKTGRSLKERMAEGLTMDEIIIQDQYVETEQLKQANQSLTEQNQKLVNEAVKMREAFEELLSKVKSELPSDLHAVFDILWHYRAGLTINEKEQ